MLIELKSPTLALSFLLVYNIVALCIYARNEIGGDFVMHQYSQMGENCISNLRWRSQSPEWSPHDNIASSLPCIMWCFMSRGSKRGGCTFALIFALPFRSWYDINNTYLSTYRKKPHFKLQLLSERVCLVISIISSSAVLRRRESDSDRWRDFLPTGGRKRQICGVSIFRICQLMITESRRKRSTSLTNVACRTL